jgi:hypothetical protein
MAQHALADNFRYFFKRINPSPTVTAQAASEYNSIKRLLEGDPTLSSPLGAQCYLQGSYGWETAIYDINDVDIVIFCQGLYYPPAQGSVSAPGTSWDRHRIFNAVISALYNDRRYRDKLMPVNSDSMCVKLDLGIKVEMLPVVRNSGNIVTDREPFYLWRPQRNQWELGYASMHRSQLSAKNLTTAGNFIPMIKVMKHLRTMADLNAVSFHVESLLYQIDYRQFVSTPAEYIPRVLSFIAGITAEAVYRERIMTPCGDRDMFTAEEWGFASWQSFHNALCNWAILAEMAASKADRHEAIQWWKRLLGDDYFPWSVSS